jgi:hypothetical protein
MSQEKTLDFLESKRCGSHWNDSGGFGVAEVHERLYCASETGGQAVQILGDGCLAGQLENLVGRVAVLAQERLRMLGFKVIWANP